MTSEIKTAAKLKVGDVVSSEGGRFGTVKSIEKGKPFRTYYAIQLEDGRGFSVRGNAKFEVKDADKLNARYLEIRARANELLDNARFNDADWQNEQFELNVEYNAVCDQLKELGYTGIENFPGN